MSKTPTRKKARSDDTVVISFRVAKVTGDTLKKEVKLIKDTLKLHRKFTISDYEAIINSHRKSILDRILSGDIPITHKL